MLGLFSALGAAGLDRLDDETVLDAVYAGQAALGLPQDELGTTLLFAAVKDGCFFAGHMGDGVILRKRNGGFSLLSAPENGEFEYITYFVPTSDRSHFRFYRGEVSTGKSFLLTSDGLSGLLYDAQTGKGMPACEKIDQFHRKHGSAQCKKRLKDAMRELFSWYSSDDMSIALLSLKRV